MGSSRVYIKEEKNNIILTVKNSPAPPAVWLVGTVGAVLQLMQKPFVHLPASITSKQNYGDDKLDEQTLVTATLPVPVVQFRQKWYLFQFPLGSTWGTWFWVWARAPVCVCIWEQMVLFSILWNISKAEQINHINVKTKAILKIVFLPVSAVIALRMLFLFCNLNFQDLFIF